MAGVVVPGAMAKEDTLATVMKGLAIAKDIYGIKLSKDQADALRLKEEEASKGILTPAEEAEYTAKLSRVDPSMPGALIRQVRGPQGALATVAFAPKPEKAAKKPTRLVEYIGPKGEKIQEIVEDEPGYKVTSAKPAPDDEKAKEKVLEATTTLRKEYVSNPITKATAEMSMGFEKVKRAAQAKVPTGASDMSLVYGVMKLQDPGSTVREGEYASAENTRGVPDSIRALYNKALNGERLTDQQRLDFYEASKDLMQGQLVLQAEENARYKDIASKFGIDHSFVINPAYESKLNAIISERQQKERRPSKSSAGAAFAAPKSDSFEAPLSLDDLQRELSRRGVK